MSSGWIRIAFVLGSVGCAKKVTEAPKELGDLGLFLFEHFEDEDPAEMAAGLVNMRGQIESQDMSLAPKDRAVVMPVLEGDNLGSLSIPEGAAAADQLPIALAGESIHPVDKQVILALEENQVCIESATTVWARREFLSDTACFEDGSCDTLEVLQEVRKENALADVWFDQYKTYRWYELEDDEGNITRALVGRSWIEEVFPADGGGNSWDQLFHLDLYIENPEDPEKTLRWFSLWSSVTVNLLGDDLYSSLVVTGIAEALEFGDEFISGNIEACKLDRDAEKPPRD